MRSTKPHRAGEPYARSGRYKSCSLDAGSFDRIQWLRHVTQRLLKAEAGTSVLVRRALVVYCQHMESLLAGHTAEELEREVSFLSHAARGDTNPIPDDELLAVPVRPFSVIRDEAAEARRIAGVRETKAFMDQCMAEWDHKARGLGFDV